ncbi:hypothetical protein BDZ88DRAFT_505743 [Geranomyces variabilis]|nr:hypothetical protein BDZ88DRAFT_505743 [Geranomyces variabilis]KAJ3133072.1 hypothetical protein HDU90_006414 [Geranomyces variabilis]
MDNFAEGEDDQGVGAHKDNWLTFLLQASNDVNGLEIQNNAGEWFVAPPMPGSFVVNSGIGIERITHRAEAAYTKCMEPWTEDERYLTGCAETSEISASATYGRVSDDHTLTWGNNHYSADFVNRVLEEGPNSHPLAAEIAAKVGARGYAQVSRPSTLTPNVTPSGSRATSPASIVSSGTTLHSESNKSVGMVPQSKISLLEEKLALLSYK